MTDIHSDIFETTESNVRSYCRTTPAIFDHAEGAFIFDADGNPYLDFLAGAGSLNYGHNNPVLQERLVDYIKSDGITNSLDFHTTAKGRFLQVFQDVILKPRNMDYVVQFTGPTGANAVEAAFKVARRLTGRTGVVAFTNGFHGVTLGALSATGNQHHRGAAGTPLTGVQRMPFASYLGDDVNTLDYFERVLEDPSSGVDLPACVVAETVQGEGGLNVASSEWLLRLQEICRRHSVVFIIDDIQAGCGRTGTFFSFEEAGLSPDLVTLSKSLSGYGLPLAVLLIKTDLDCWQPGEHNGTFRGFNHAFVTATAALEEYWDGSDFEQLLHSKAAVIEQRLAESCKRFPKLEMTKKGRGLMQGLSFANPEDAMKVAADARNRRLVIETSGPNDEVLKMFPPLTISQEDLSKGLCLVEESLEAVQSEKSQIQTAAE